QTVGVVALLGRNRSGVFNGAQRNHMRFAGVIGVVLRAELGAEGIELVLAVQRVVVNIVVTGQEASRSVEHGRQLAGLMEESQVISHEVSDEQDAAAGVV